IFAFSWCLENLAQRNRPRLNGLVFAGVGAGIAIVGVLCVALMRIAANSAQAWIVLGLVALAVSAGLWGTFGVRPGSSTSAPVVMQPTARSMKWSGASLRLVFCFGAAGFGYIIPATFLPLMARQVMQDPIVFGWSWPLFGAAAMVSTLAASALPDSADNRRVWTAS